MEFIKETVLSFRHSHSLSIVFVVLCLMPVSVMNGGIFYWIFTALSSLITTLQERKQTEKLQLFQRLWFILTGSMTIATMALMFQFFNLSRSPTSRWQSQWLFADGVSHTLFLFVLVAMMYLWAPNKNNQRYAYSEQIDGDAESVVDKPAVCADDDIFECGVVEEDSLFAEAIGSAAKDKDAEAF